MKIRCLIVDDEPPALRVLEKYIEGLPLLELAGKCKNAMEAMEALHAKPIDLLFLDINMPKMTGLVLLQSLPRRPLVVLTTAYREYALEGYELDVLDYLTKPISFERFLRAVNKASERLAPAQPAPAPLPEPGRHLAQDDAFIFVKDDKLSYRIALRDILYIESVGDYVKVITQEKVYLSNQTLKTMESRLPASLFARVHKSFIVAMGKIGYIDGMAIKIGASLIPIGQTYRKEFMERVEGGW